MEEPSKINTYYRVKFQSENGIKSFVGKLVAETSLLYQFQVSQKFSNKEGLTEQQEAIDKTLITQMREVKAEWKNKGNTSYYVEVK